MSLPPPPAAPQQLKSPTTPNMRPQKPETVFFPQPSQQQIEERMNKTREVFAKIGQIKALSPQLTQSPSYVFIPTNSSFMNEAIVVLPRIDNDGNFQLPPPPTHPDLRPSSVPQLNPRD